MISKHAAYSMPRTAWGEFNACCVLSKYDRTSTHIL